MTDAPNRVEDGIIFRIEIFLPVFRWLFFRNRSPILKKLHKV